MATALDYITDALVSIGVYSDNDVIPDADSNRGLIALNDMLDSWSNERLAVYANSEQSGTLTVGKFSYTVGSGGDFNVTRPLAILDSPGSVYIVDQNGMKYNVSTLQQQDWNMLAARGQANVQSTIPLNLFYDPQYPLGVMNFYPTPAAAYQVFWDSRIQLSDLTLLTSVVSLPPGYGRAIKRNLAVELWPYFKAEGSQTPPELLRAAMQSFAMIKRTNRKQLLASYDRDLMIGRVRGGYNIFTDDYYNTG